MKKLLILGRNEKRSFFHLDGSSILKDLPFPVLIFTDAKQSEYFKGLGENVEVEVIRWSDEKKWVNRAREIHAETPLLGIATSNEMMMDVAGRLREEFGLPGMGVEMTSRFRDKRKMKDLLNAAGLRVPQHSVCEDRESVNSILASNKKMVIKPFDGLGSKGVAFIESEEDLKNWYDECSDLTKFQAEEFIDGTLYHVNAIVVDGHIKMTLSAPYLPGMANIDFTSGAPFVSLINPPSELRDRLEDYSNDVIKHLGMTNGVTHMECFVTDDEEIIFCEIGARPGGGGIVWMMEGFSGVNFSHSVLLLEAGLGSLISFSQSKPQSKSQQHTTGMMGFRWPSNGFLRSLPDESNFDESWIHHYSNQYSVGDFVVKATHCTDYVGLIIFSSKNQEEFSSRRAALYDRFYNELEVESL